MNRPLGYYIHHSQRVQNNALRYLRQTIDTNAHSSTIINYIRLNQPGRYDKHHPHYNPSQKMREYERAHNYSTHKFPRRHGGHISNRFLIKEGYFDLDDL